MPLVPEKNGNEFRRQAVNKMKKEMRYFRERTRKKITNSKNILKILEGIGFTSTTVTALMSVTGSGLAFGAILPPMLPLTFLSGLLASIGAIVLGVSKTKKKKIAKLTLKLKEIDESLIELDKLISKALSDEVISEEDFDEIMALRRVFLDVYIGAMQPTTSL